MRVLEVVLLIAFLSVVPLLISFHPYWMYVQILALIYAFLACSWDLLAGYTGISTFSHGAFFGIGAYSSAIMTLGGVSPWLSLLLSPLVCAALSGTLALIGFRLRGFYFAIVTLGFQEIVYRLLFIWKDVTGGPGGLTGIPLLPGVPDTKLAYYYLILVFFSVSLFIMFGIVNSRIGLILRSIRDDELLAKTRGVNTGKYKTFIFLISSFFPGLAGAFYCHYFAAISPEIMELTTMVTILASTVVGGLASLVGPAIGAFMMLNLTEYLRVFSPYFRIMLIGLSIIAFRLFVPGGITSQMRRVVNHVNNYIKKAGKS
ncbi:MAG: branched-chain amino acid ABC transporter permease [Candidatus Hodarchaeota archaeon]